MIWEPFVLALVLGIVVSAGLYFAYLWPSVEPLDDEPSTATAVARALPGAASAPATATDEAAGPA